MNSSKPVLHLSQSNLQDFKDCPRRFQLKVLENIAWPAAYLEPLSQLEKATDLGNRFHQLSQQFFTGVDAEVITSSITDPDLRDIFERFLPFAAGLKGEKILSECILSAPFLGHQLIAKFDLLLKKANGQLIIYDWKTSSKKPSRSTLSQRFQTLLYPFILAKAGGSLFKNNQPSPNLISMNYYYPLCTDPEEIFPYSDDQHSRNAKIIAQGISNIENLIDSNKAFPLTEERSLCQRCVYRSLCERGIQAGKVDLFTEIDQEDLSSEHFDFDNIIELEY